MFTVVGPAFEIVRSGSADPPPLLTSVVAVAVVVKFCAVFVPLTDAVRGARDPADFIRDYVTARARLDGGRGAPPSGESANDLGERLGTPRVLLLGGPYYLHPPPALLAVMPIAWLPWHAAWDGCEASASAAAWFLAARSA